MAVFCPATLTLTKPTLLLSPGRPNDIQPREIDRVARGSLSLGPFSSVPPQGRTICANRTEWRRRVLGSGSEEDKFKRPSPVNFPTDWQRPKPPQRPDIFPRMKPMVTPAPPPPVPRDPPLEDDEEEEVKKEEEGEKEDEDSEMDEGPKQHEMGDEFYDDLFKMYAAVKKCF